MSTTCPLSLPLTMAPCVPSKNPRYICRDGLRAMRLESGARMLFLSCPLPCIQGRSFVRAAEEDPAVLPTAEEDEEEYSVLTAMTTLHNDIVVVDNATSRFLLLDSTHNVHSMINKEQLWTGSYWDEFASLPAIIPEGPIAILGLGGGTAAHTMLKLWPNLQLEGWEIDEILIDIARKYFGLSELEKFTPAGGYLSVHIGDALSESVRTEGGFAGIIVDLFSGGKILEQLKEVHIIGGEIVRAATMDSSKRNKISTWLDIEKKLMPQGRIMVNCGGAYAEVFGSGDRTANTDALSTGSWIQNASIMALCQAFPGKLSWKRMAEKDSDNYLALTGPLPDLDAWSAALPSPLSMNAKEWRTCELDSCKVWAQPA